MLKRTKSQALKDNAASATDFAAALAKDKKFRQQVLSAVSHGTLARRRAASRIGFLAAVTRLSTDPKLKNELRKMTKNVENAWARIDKRQKRSVRQIPAAGQARNDDGDRQGGNQIMCTAERVCVARKRVSKGAAISRRCSPEWLVECGTRCDDGRCTEPEGSVMRLQRLCGCRSRVRQRRQRQQRGERSYH